MILREEARYDVPNVPLASPEFFCVTVCSLTSRRIFDMLTACQKTFVITKKTAFAVVFQYFAEDFAISEYFKIVLIMMVKQTSCCAQQHRFCPHHVLDNFITFHLRAPGRNHIVSVPLEAMEIPCFVNEHFCLGTQTITHINTSTGTSKGTHSSSSPKFLFFCLSCSLSDHFLFCDHAVKKKNSLISNFHLNFVTHIVIFLQNNNGKGPVSISPLYSSLK